MWSFQVSMSCRVAFSQLMQDKFGETALITASAYGHIDVAELLLARGTVVDYQRKVRVLYIDGPHGVAQNGVLSLEQLRWGILHSYVAGHHSVWVVDAWRMVG